MDFRFLRWASALNVKAKANTKRKINLNFIVVELTVEVTGEEVKPK